MTDLLYHWPATAKFGRAVPKTKFYEQGTVSAAVREKFVTEVQRITWAYKLAESTINLPGSQAVPEIQVFQITAKNDDVADPALAAIDKAVQYPIIFEIDRIASGHSEVRMVAAQKLLGGGTPKLSAYYSTDWQARETTRQPLPTAITLPGLYAGLLQPLTSLAARPNEEMSEVADRLAAVRRLERQVAALERKIRSEPQLNRKIELRRELKDRQAMLTSLM